MSRQFQRAYVLLACAGVAGTAVAGCGDDGDAETIAGERPPVRSLANEPPRVFAVRLAKLLATSKTKPDCLSLLTINSRSVTQFVCPPSKSTDRAMAGFEVVGAEEYGNGAIVDYRSKDVDAGAAIVLSVGAGRAWAVNRFGVVTKPSTGTSDHDSRSAFRAVVDAYLAAVRERDCDTIAAVTFTKRSCEQTLSFTKPLARRLRAAPGAELRYQGGNAVYGFFSLETPKPKPANTTFSVIRDRAAKSSEREYIVLDVTASPTAAQQRKALAALARQQRKPKTSRSRKAGD